MEKLPYSIEYSHFYARDLVEENLDEEVSQGIERAKEAISDLDRDSYTLNVLIDDYNEPIEVEENVVFAKLKSLGLAPDFIMRESRISSVANRAIESIRENYIEFRKKKGETIFEVETDDILLWGESGVMNSQRRPYKSVFLEKTLREGEDDNQDSFLHDVKKEEEERVLLARSTHTSKFEILLRYLDENNEKKFTCALMTACWYLMRLGEKPFTDLEAYLTRYSKKPFVAQKLINILPAKYIKTEGTALEIISLMKSKTYKKHKNNVKYFFF